MSLMEIAPTPIRTNKIANPARFCGAVFMVQTYQAWLHSPAPLVLARALILV
jgi:hypothetical protein